MSLFKFIYGQTCVFGEKLRPEGTLSRKRCGSESKGQNVMAEFPHSEIKMIFHLPVCWVRFRQVQLWMNNSAKAFFVCVSIHAFVM